MLCNVSNTAWFRERLRSHKKGHRLVAFLEYSNLTCQQGKCTYTAVTYCDYFSTQTVLICFSASTCVLKAAGPIWIQVVSVGRVSTTLHFFVAFSWTM